LEEPRRNEQHRQRLVDLAKLKIRKLGEFYEKHYEDYRACLIPLYQAAIRNSIVLKATPPKDYPIKDLYERQSVDA